MGLLSDFIKGTVLKVLTNLFKTCGLNGVFLLHYNISVTICVLLSYKHLPETKHKTSEEIENSIKKVQKPQDEGFELSSMFDHVRKGVGKFSL